MMTVLPISPCDARARRAGIADERHQVSSVTPAATPDRTSLPPLRGHLIAVDVGRTGAAALFDTVGRLLAVEDLPVLTDGPAGRPTINAILLAGLVQRWAPREAVVEHVSARPGEAPSGAFAFGRSRGVIEGVLGAAGVPARHVTPSWWKRRVGIPPGRDHKDTARSVAIARWPTHAELFARVKDHNRAEAALIGLAYLHRS